MLGSGIPQPRLADGTPASSHPLFRPHLMQGWSPDFIPKLTEDAVAAKLIDRVLPVNGGEAMRLARELARKEGIFVGTSSGATFAGALEVCKSAPPGSNVLCMLPDTGERYLSTPLFADIPADMTEEEIAIARSTPRFRFDAQAPKVAAPAKAPEPPAAVTPAAAEFVAEVTSDKKQPVVMFALEWCEFCWSVRKLFTKLGIAYRSVDVDSVEYQKDDLGGKIRAVLADQTGAKTLPQVYVGGEHLGGATDLFDAWRAGKLQKLLDDNGVAYDREVSIDPYTLLPKWLQPRKSA
jgi:cysteine synthase A